MRYVIRGDREAVLIALNELASSEWWDLAALKSAVAARRESEEIRVVMRKYRPYLGFGKKLQEVYAEQVTFDNSFYYNKQEAVR